MQSPSAPQTPNPTQIGQQQATQNVQTGIANATLGNTNQVTPYGNLTYTETGGKDVGGNWVPSYTATQILSPEQQAIYDKTTGLQSGALDTAKNVMGQYCRQYAAQFRQRAQAADRSDAATERRL